MTTAVIILVAVALSQANIANQEIKTLIQEMKLLKEAHKQTERKRNETETRLITEAQTNKDLIAVLQNTTSQTHHDNDNLTQEVKLIREQIQIFHPVGTFYNPFTSCKEIPNSSPSGKYWILNNITRSPVRVYCDMEQRNCSCDSTGGWTRVANLDMTNPSQQCADGLRHVTRTTAPLRTCGRHGTGCVSTTFPVHGIEYSRVCGRIIGYQVGTSEGFRSYHYNGQTTIDGYYIDGVSLTHGQSPREHIWTFVAASGESYTSSVSACPCLSNGVFTVTIPSFIDQDYFCDTALRHAGNLASGRLYSENPLWDGQGCGSTSTCCEFNNPPWFCKQLPQATTDDIELRICNQAPTSQDDTPLEIVEIYIN